MDTEGLIITIKYNGHRDNNNYAELKQTLIIKQCTARH